MTREEINKLHNLEDLQKLIVEFYNHIKSQVDLSKNTLTKLCVLDEKFAKDLLSLIEYYKDDYNKQIDEL